MKEEKKTPTRAEGAQSLLNVVFAKTFTRHADLTEEEFLEKIGYKDTGLTEAEAVRVAMFNVCMELTRTAIQAQNTFTLAKNLFRININNENIDEDEKGEENNGK